MQFLGFQLSKTPPQPFPQSAQADFVCVAIDFNLLLPRVRGIEIPRYINEVRLRGLIPRSGKKTHHYVKNKIS